MAVAKKAQELETACNCCNGRVGHRFVELAEQNAAIRELIAPTGVELIRKSAEVGLVAKDTCNCCNGRVGKHPIEELVTMLGGGS